MSELTRQTCKLAANHVRRPIKLKNFTTRGCFSAEARVTVETLSGFSCRTEVIEVTKDDEKTSIDLAERVVGTATLKEIQRNLS